MVGDSHPHFMGRVCRKCGVWESEDFPLNEDLLCYACEFEGWDTQHEI